MIKIPNLLFKALILTGLVLVSDLSISQTIAMDGLSRQQDDQFAQSLAKQYPRFVDQTPTEHWDFDSLVSLIEDVRSHYFTKLSGEKRQEAIVKYVQAVCAVVNQNIDFLKVKEPYFSVHYFHQNIIAAYRKDWQNIFTLGRQFPKLISPCLSSNFYKFLSPLDPAERLYVCQLAHQFYVLFDKFGLVKFISALKSPIIIEGELLYPDLISDYVSTAHLLRNASETLLTLPSEKNNDNDDDDSASEEEDLDRVPLTFPSLLTQVAAEKHKIP